MKRHTYFIWCDESDKEGAFYSNFYGGILVRSDDLTRVLDMSRSLIMELGLENEEVKWQKVNAYTYKKYLRIVDFIFDLLRNDLAKIRIFFRNNQYVAQGLTPLQKRKSYSMLYYQFIKHAFGFQYSEGNANIGIFLDDMPLKGESVEEFKDYLYKLNFDEEFRKAGIHIRREDITEVDSSRHIMLQWLDLILGAICFRLNDKHKMRDPQTGKIGVRTRVKTNLYKYINSKIRELHPGFNIGESTGIRMASDRWSYSYSHWSFKPLSSLRDTSLGKRKKKSPGASN